MKKDPASDLEDELRPEYDTAFIKQMLGQSEVMPDYTGLLKEGIRGKYAGKITRIQGRPVTPAKPASSEPVTGGEKSMLSLDPETETISERAQAWYEERRGLLETPENIGKLVIVAFGSDDYEIDDETSSTPTRCLQARHPSDDLFALRIGYKTAVSFCGALEPLDDAEAVSP